MTAAGVPASTRATGDAAIGDTGAIAGSDAAGATADAGVARAVTDGPAARTESSDEPLVSGCPGRFTPAERDDQVKALTSNQLIALAGLDGVPAHPLPAGTAAPAVRTGAATPPASPAVAPPAAVSPASNVEKSGGPTVPSARPVGVPVAGFGSGAAATGPASGAVGPGFAPRGGMAFMDGTVEPSGGGARLLGLHQT